MSVPIYRIGKHALDALPKLRLNLCREPQIGDCVLVCTLTSFALPPQCVHVDWVGDYETCVWELSKRLRDDDFFFTVYGDYHEYELWYVVDDSVLPDGNCKLFCKMPDVGIAQCAICGKPVGDDFGFMRTPLSWVYFHRHCMDDYPHAYVGGVR